jgi:hypothetical protein
VPGCSCSAGRARDRPVVTAQKCTTTCRSGRDDE